LATSALVVAISAGSAHAQSSSATTIEELVVTAEKQSLIYRPIKELSEALDPSTFWRIHRGTIVNIRHIAGISRDYRGRLRVKLKQRTETLPVSAPYAQQFKQM
jgi:DNA-binding LytR/AlgR family response regulator